jgi:type IV pilus assembly protein PilY1
MKPLEILKACSVLLCVLLLGLGVEYVMAEPAQRPLFLSVVAGKPNIMLMMDSSGSMTSKVPGDGRTRLAVAKEAATDFVTTLTPALGTNPTVRLGLACYNGSNGGKLLSPLADLDATQAAAIKTQISQIKASGVTPLATTLSDIGYYFATGNPGNLTLHPGQPNETTATMATVFGRSDSQSSGLAGFNLQNIQTCTVTTALGNTPDDMPPDANPSCSSIVDGGASTANDATVSTPIQMIVVGSQPTLCTGQQIGDDSVCLVQNSVGNAGGLPDCTQCDSELSISGESIIWDQKPAGTPPALAINASGTIEAHESPNVSGGTVDFSNATSSVCTQYNEQTVQVSGQYRTRSTVKGSANGTCRICATVKDDDASYRWSPGNTSTLNGVTCNSNRIDDQQCTNWSHSGCQRVGDSWSEWNHSGYDDRGYPYRCRWEGDDWCTDWSSGSNRCRTWGDPCHRTSGICACNGTLSTCKRKYPCYTSPLDITIGTGGGGGGVSNNGDTGGTLQGNLCFDNTKYYRIQYYGSPDIYGPYLGKNLNWYFGQTGFTEGSLELPETTEQTNCNSANLPIQNYCQKSFAVLISDGLPNVDRNVSNLLKDYTGDCARGLCNATANSTQLPGVNTQMKGTGTACKLTNTKTSSTGPNNMLCQNGTKVGRAYETGGSDYLDDVAKALYEMDLRPDLGVTEKALSHVKNNLTTYAIGFADPSLQANSVLNAAASLGGGAFFYAADSQALANALDSVIGSISAQVGSSASVATNSSRVESGSTLYQAKFDSGGWIGHFLAYPINSDGSIGDLAWNAAELIPAPDARTILTYNPEAAGTKGTTFECANLGAAQKTALGISNCNSADDIGVWRLNYLRGDASHELRNPGRVLVYDTETRSADPAVAKFRNRTRLDPLTNHALTPDPWVLGDIVNSNPVFVGTEDYGYQALPGTEGSSYIGYRNSAAYANRQDMVYVGANDGMLHGFDASASGPAAGTEVVAYIPNAVYPRAPSDSDCSTGLCSLTNPGYSHRYFVDGSPRAGDAYFGNAWHTVLVGTTGAGGKGVFALDITDPSDFGPDKVLWEFSDTNAANASDLASFQNDLGFALPQASVVRMKNDTWAAVVANGYDSVSKKAVLYIINLQNGSIIRTLDTGVGNAGTPNGLSTPIVTDVNGDRIADYIYAGDLLGNLWKFDVTDADANHWAVAYGGNPLFVACDPDAAVCDAVHRQSITAKPQVGRGPSGGYMVYFGTGKYYELADNDLSNLKTQTFYGIWDNNATVSGRATLQEQTIMEEFSLNGVGLRTTSSNPVDFAVKKGWYLDLLQPPLPTKQGERVVSFPQLRGSRVIFTTLIPIPPAGGDDQCNAVSGGTGWLMELIALTGSRLPNTGSPPWDINDDGKIDENDFVDGESPSGVQSTVGIPTAPGVVKLNVDNDGDDDGNDGDDSQCLEMKYVVGSNGNLQSQLESCTPGTGAPAGRQAWRQLR